MVVDFATTHVEAWKGDVVGTGADLPLHVGLLQVDRRVSPLLQDSLHHVAGRGKIFFDLFFMFSKERQVSRTIFLLCQGSGGGELRSCFSMRGPLRSSRSSTEESTAR